MKLTLTFAALVLAGNHAYPNEAIPKKWDKERYEETVAASPFVLETPKADDAAPPPPPEKMFVTLISNVENKPYVVLQTVGSTDPLRYMLGEKGEDGITVTEVKMGESFATSEVEIEQNGKRRWIKFNERMESAPAVPRPAPGGNARAAQPPSVTPTINTGGATLKNTAPTNIPRPTNAPTAVPQPGGAVQPPSFRGGRSGSSTAPNTGDQRQRVRTINNR